MDSTARARAREAGGNLPAEVTSFIGRRREITLTKRLLAESRVVTLTGPGGVGKSRLAIRVATTLRRNYRDKAWQVELGELDDPALLPATVVEQLHIGGTSTGDSTRDIIEYIRNSEMLLVLDNCEHLVQECALLVDTLVRSCPGLRVLATSRQSLGVAGEATVVVPPMQVPDPEQRPTSESAQQYASVRLFVERAGAVIPDFEPSAQDNQVIMRLCHQLDGNPLAIELAVVRLRSLSLQQLEQRLAQRYELLTQGRRGAPARQRTLRALIDWSYDLCTEGDRRAWAHASVFSGSFDLDAAEHVIDGEHGHAGIDSIVHSLVDKSVLLREEDSEHGRYRMPHTLRDYGLEKLAAAGESALVQARHRDWYANLVDRFSAEWIGPDQPAWIERLSLDQGNLRAALRCATSQGGFSGQFPSDFGVALRMASRLGQYWGVQGLHAEARQWLDRALAAGNVAPVDRAAALRANAWFALLQGDVISATPLIRDAQALADQHGDAVEHAYLAHTRGMGALFQGQLDTADELMGWALVIFRRHELLDGELFSLFGLGLARGLSTAPTEGPDAGIALLKECIEITTGVGEIFWRSYALWALAYLELERDHLDRAEQSAKDALRLQRRMENRLATAFTTDTLAWIAQRQGNNHRAARLFGAAASVWEFVKAAPAFYATFAAQHDAHQAAAMRTLGAENYREAFETGYRWPFGTAVDYALEIKKSAREGPRDNVHPMLTRREREIAQLVAQGRTNKEIAENLVIALRTVEGHVQHILTKLDFSSRAQIAGWVAGQASHEAG